ncbi:MAG: STAS domain-containing protein [Nannocystaceae bacterium]|nr:STAS domain-containing protein [Myxococcales bacterium]
MRDDGRRDDGERFSADVLEQLANAMMTISCVEFGDYEVRVDITLGERHPFTQLLHGINEMIEWLAVARQQREAYLAQLRETQRAALLELSSPIIEVMDGVLCMPVIGAVDPERGARMTEALLARVAAAPVRRVVIDVTAIKDLDGVVVRQLVLMIQATRLLGTECVVSGLNPRLAQLVVEAELELPDIELYQTLKDAIQPLTGASARSAPALSSRGRAQK